MVIKAYVKELPENDDNHFVVRIPFLEDNTQQEVTYKALLCHQPGSYQGINVGDCVFLAFEANKYFEDNKFDLPVIIGKLFVDGDIKDCFNNYYTERLKVTGEAILPKNTKFGEYTPDDIFNLTQKADGLNGAINGYWDGTTYHKGLEERVKELEAKLDRLA